jgi:hypothetical protein
MDGSFQLLDGYIQDALRLQGGAQDSRQTVEHFQTL